MLGVYVRLSVFMEGCEAPLCESVSSDDLVIFRIPYDKLETGLVFEVEMVKVAVLAASSTYSTE